MQYDVFFLRVQIDAVKSSELTWLPGGSEFILKTEKSTLDSTLKEKTYTSFSCSQNLLPGFSNNKITPKHDDITIARLGPGQVWFSGTFFFPMVNHTWNRTHILNSMFFHLLTSLIGKVLKYAK